MSPKFFTPYIFFFANIRSWEHTCTVAKLQSRKPSDFSNSIHSKAWFSCNYSTKNDENMLIWVAVNTDHYVWLFIHMYMYNTVITHAPPPTRQKPYYNLNVCIYTTCMYMYYVNATSTVMLKYSSLGDLLEYMTFPRHDLMHIHTFSISTISFQTAKYTCTLTPNTYCKCA